VIFEGRFVRRAFEEFQHPSIQTKNSAALCGIFSSIKSEPASRKKGFYTNCVLKKQEVGGIFV
jgi:hypothetical protein